MTTPYAEYGNSTTSRYVEPIFKFYCIIIERSTGKLIAEYPDIEAIDWYYARHQAAKKFRESDMCANAPDWCVDSIEIEE